MIRLFLMLAVSGCVATVAENEGGCPCRIGWTCDVALDRCIRDVIPSRDAGTNPAMDGGVDGGTKSGPIWLDVEVAGDETCALAEDGRVACWGGARGPTPTFVEGIVDGVELAFAGEHGCVIRGDRTVACFGADPVATPALAIATGARHTCIITASDEVECWGADDNRQLEGNTLGLTEVSAIVAQGDMACAGTRNSGVVTCWGRGADVQTIDFGDPAQFLAIEEDRGGERLILLTESEIIAHDLGRTTRQFRAARGGRTSPSNGCYVDAEARLRCHFDFDPDGYLPRDYFRRPVQTDADYVVAENVRSVSRGPHHACLVKTSGELACFGRRNDVGQLGLGYVAERTGRERVPDLLDVASLSAGPFGACAISSVGSLTCWGFNTAGGYLGHDTWWPGPTAASITRGVQQVVHFTTETSTNPFRFGDMSIAVLVDQQVQIFGEQASGQGVALAELDGAIRIAAAGDEVCALLLDGTARCVRTTSVTSTTIDPFLGARELALDRGGRWKFAIIGDTLACVPGTEPCPNVDAIQETSAIATGDGFVCVIDSNDEVYCAGPPANLFGSMNFQSVGLSDAFQLTAYDRHVCAQKTTGQTFCWGDNHQGQVDASMTSPIDPTDVGSFGALVAGARFTCGSDGGEVTCWGANDECQLSRCETMTVPVPMPIAPPE